MKQIILQIATDLIKQNGSTTNLDIKNRYHKEYPGSNLTQAEVSSYMDEIMKEEDYSISWGKANGHSFRVFSKVFTAATPITPVVSTNSISISSTKLHKDYKKFISKGKLLCYVTGRPDAVIQGDSKYFVKSEANKYFGPKSSSPIAKWDDLRVCTVNYYNKKFVGE